MERRSKVCTMCAKKKIKCDRLVPCGNCVRKGYQDMCLASLLDHNQPTEMGDLLALWQNYEYWVIHSGLLRSKEFSTRTKKFDFAGDTEIYNFWVEFLNEEQSYNLLNFSMENLGAIYFGSFGDVSELFIQLKSFWDRRNDPELVPSLDDIYWDCIMWAILTMAVYYMSLKELQDCLPMETMETICDLLQIDADAGWTETLQLTIYHGFVKTTLHLLQMTNYMTYPNIKLIQIFLVLSNTTFINDEPVLANSLILQCFQISKIFNISFHKESAEDDLNTGLNKQAFSKLWFKLCTMDYIMDGPNKPISFHNELQSVLQHAAFYQDMPNRDIYQPEDNFETLCWRLFSLERDVDKFAPKNTKPPLKTLDAVRRELNIFRKKIDNISILNKKNSLKGKITINAQFEEFLSKFLLNAISWRLNKLYLIYYNKANALELLINYTNVLVGLILRNISMGNETFNKHPWIFNYFCKMGSFFSYYNIFKPGVPEVETCMHEFRDAIDILPIVLGERVNKLNFVISRLNSLKEIWDKVEVIDTKKRTVHPVLRILQNDIKFFSKYHYKVPLLIRTVNNIGTRTTLFDLDLEDIDINEFLNDDDALTARRSEEFSLIVKNFQKQLSIVDLVNK